MQNLNENADSANFNSQSNFDLSDYYISTDGITNASFQEPDFNLKTLNERLLTDTEIKSDFKIELINGLHNLYFEFGVRSEIQDIFKKYHDKYGILAIEWLSKLFISNVDNLQISLGIVLLLSTLDFEHIGGFGEIIVLNALLIHKDIEVQEAAIRTIENWRSVEFLDILKHMVFQSQWLDEYKESVIADLS